MGYRFKLTEGFAEGLVRIGEEQLDRARKQLETAPPSGAVHETRKCMKRLRALLRLARSGIGEASFHSENVRLRDLARLLSASRDRDVLQATSERLAGDGALLAGDVTRLKASIEALATHDAVPITTAVEQALDRVAAARTQWSELRLEPDDITPIAEGVATGMKRLSKALVAAENGEDEAVHDWRKAIQQHWRHMRLLEAGWPAYFEARAEQAREVSEWLGQAQDLTLLIGHVQTAGMPMRKAEVRRVVEVASERRQRLRDAARAGSLRLVAEGANGLARRTQLYWEAAALARACPVDVERDPAEAPAVPSAARSASSRRESPRRARARATGPGGPRPQTSRSRR